MFVVETPREQRAYSWFVSKWSRRTLCCWLLLKQETQDKPPGGVRWEQGFEGLHERAVWCKDNPLFCKFHPSMVGLWELQRKLSWYSEEQVTLKEKQLQMYFVSESHQVLPWLSLRRKVCDEVALTVPVTTNAKCFQVHGCHATCICLKKRNCQCRCKSVYIFFAVIMGSEKSTLKEKGLFEPLFKVRAIISGNQGSRTTK